MLRTRRQSLDIGERQRALRCVELALLRVALEQPGDVALAGRDDDEVGLRGVFFQVRGGGLLVFDRAAALFEFLHPAREFQSLVDRLRGLIEQAVPFDGLVAGAVGCGDYQADGIHRWAFLVPEIQPELTLVAQRLVEHALARHHLAGADVVALTVLDQMDVVAGRQEAIAELQARLAAADDRDLSFRRTHRALLLCSRDVRLRSKFLMSMIFSEYRCPPFGIVPYSISKGIAASARSGPMAV